jgi:hypothetical protein
MKTITKSKKVLLGLGVMVLVCVTVAFAAVNVKGLIVDALTGYTVGGAAPSNHTLCGNGTVYVDAAACGPVLFSATHDVTGSRAWSSVYQNTTGLPMSVDGYGLAVTGSSTNNISCFVGTTSTPTIEPFSQTGTATVSGGAASFHLLAPNNSYYECFKVNDMAGSPASWVETY